MEVKAADEEEVVEEERPAGEADEDDAAAKNPIGDPSMLIGVNGIEAKLSLEFSDM